MIFPIKQHEIFEKYGTLIALIKAVLVKMIDCELLILCYIWNMSWNVSVHGERIRHRKYKDETKHAQRKKN